MRVLLVYPNAKKEIIGWGDMGAIAEPIALEYVGAGAKQDGHEVRLLDLRLHPDDLETTLREFRPDVVGVTGYSMHVLRALDVCRIAKEILPGVVTVAGGHHATLEPTDYFEPQIDHVVTGEGVRPFRSILALTDQKGGSQPIAGTWSRLDGKFQFGGEQGALSIDSLPRPDRSLCPEDRDRYYIDWMRPIALMRTTVGCPYRCSFCSLWRIMDGRYYKREIDQVVEEIKSIPERYIFFVDDEPFVDPKRMKLMAEAIRDQGIDKEYFAYCRIDSLLRDLELMKLWRSVGLRRLLIGVETIFDYELKEYNKRQQKQQIIDGLRRAKDIGLSLFCNFIVNPNYTKREFEEIVQFIKENDVDYPSFTILTPIPGIQDGGTDYTKVTMRQDNGRPHWDYFDLQHAVLPTTMPKEQFMHEYDSLYRVFWMNYAQADSPITVQTAKERDERLRETYLAVARHILGAGGLGSGPAA
jgi:radical SAM superfamily enzyme YgiQ (UPF0313 family)